MAIKIKKGDTVIMLAGKDRTKKGKVSQLLVSDNKVVVDGLNSFVKHIRARQQKEKGQKITFSAAVPVAKVMLVCPKCSKPTRVGYKLLENAKKVRQCRKCKEVIE